MSLDISEKSGSSSSTPRRKWKSGALPTVALSALAIIGAANCGGRSDLEDVETVPGTSIDGGTPAQDAGPDGSDSGVVCPEILHSTVSPEIFNPAKQDAYIYFKNNDPGAFVSVGIHDIQGNPLKYLLSNVKIGTDFRVFPWDGRDSEGALVGEGNYEYRIVADNGGCESMSSGKIVVQQGAEFMCPPGTFCVHKLRPTDDLQIGTQSRCLDVQVINAFPEPVEIDNWNAEFRMPNAQASGIGLLTGNSPNFTEIRFDELSPDMSVFYVLFGPQQLSVSGNNPDKNSTQLITFTDEATVPSVPPEEPFMGAVTTHIADLQVLIGSQFQCNLLIPPHGVMSNGQEVPVLITPQDPQSEKLFGNSLFIQ